MGYDQLARPVRAAQGGEYSSLNPNSVGPQFLKKYINCTMENDCWETELGTVAMAGALAGTPTIGTIFQYLPGPFVERLIACGRDGTIHKSSDDGVTWRLLKSGLSAGTLMVPVVGGAETTGKPAKAFLFGGGAPQVLTGDADTDAAITDPAAAPVLVLVNASGAVNIGIHSYVYTFVNAIGETAPSPLKQIQVFNGNAAQVQITVPVGPAGTTARKIYRTRSLTFQPTDDNRLFLLTTLNDNGTTVYVDNFSDGQLGTQLAPVYNATATMHQISRPPADWSGGNQPTGGFILEGRLCAFGNNNGVHFLYVSSKGDHEDFLTTPILIPVFTGQGAGISGGIYWRGQGWAFKTPRGIYRIDTSAIDPNQWQVHLHSDAVGLVGPMALCLIQGSDKSQFFDDVVFVSPDGQWHRLSKTEAYQQQDVNASSISNETYGQFIRENVDKGRLPFCQLVYFETIEEIWGSFTAIGAAINKLRIKANIKRMPEFGIRFHHSTFPECEAMALHVHDDGSRFPIYGGSAGVGKHQYMRRIYTDAGASYRAEFFTWDDSFQDLGEGYKLAKKNYHALVVEAVPTGDWNLNVDIYIDGVLQPTSLLINLKGKGVTFILDESTLDQTTLDFTKPVFVTKRLRGRGHRIAYNGYINTETGQYFQVQQLNTLFSLGGFSGGNKG